MRTATLAVGLGLVSLLSCSAAFGLGREYAPGQPVMAQPDWPEGLVDLLNREGRVHGYMINANDWFFYAGDTDAFNEFLAQYAQLEGTPLILVLHVGQGKVTPWHEDAEEIPFEWQVSVLRRGWTERVPEAAEEGELACVALVDLWLGCFIELEKLEVPLNVTVKSGGEIEAFIEAHQARQAEAAAQ
jgi:hypothetical protein